MTVHGQALPMYASMNRHRIQARSIAGMERVCEGDYVRTPGARAIWRVDVAARSTERPNLVELIICAVDSHDVPFEARVVDLCNPIVVIEQSRAI